MKKVLVLLLATLVLALAACTGGTAEPIAVVPAWQSTSASGVPSGTAASAGTAAGTIAVEYDGDDLDATAGTSAMSYIELAGDAIILDRGGAVVDGSVVTINSAGTYNISGALSDGQVVVDAPDGETVRLVLDGAEIACSSGPAIYVVGADKVVITLAEGTENRVSDGVSYVLVDDSGEPNAAVFSKADLTINGDGSLSVYGSYSHGIFSKDDLKIAGGTITVDAANDGIKGRDSIAVKGGTITIDAGGDGMQSNNDVDADKGYIAIEGGTLRITAGLDGIQAASALSIGGGDIAISSGGGSANSSDQAGWGDWGRPGNPSDDTTPSAKGLKAGVEVTIAGGTIQIDSSDDSVHSDAHITIAGGDLLLTSGDDGMHADTALSINGGKVRITQSYEGLESAAITINDGEIHVAAGDDGLNVVGGNDGSAFGGRPGQGGFTACGDCYLAVNGGYLTVDATGDGMDINGPIYMAGGVVILNGPTANNNGALDYAGEFRVSGGFLVAVGSAGMAMAPSASSTQHAVMVNLPYAVSGGTMVHIAAQDGQDVLTFVPTKDYQSIVLSSPALQNGATYAVYIGGSSSGSAADGLYGGGSYTAGSQAGSFTLSGIVTLVGSYGGGFPGGGGRPPGRP